MKSGKQTRRSMTQTWTCESCEFWDDGYCCVKMRWKQEDDYCDKWSDRYDAEDKE